MKGIPHLVGVRDLVARTTPVRATRQRLAALYAPASLGDSHALCKFPARVRFLGETLELGTLPKPVCAARDGFYARLRPRRVLFVFSAYHVTSPASAFGHVLLRVERDETGILREGAPEHPLADIGIDYSADGGCVDADVFLSKVLAITSPQTVALQYRLRFSQGFRFQQPASHCVGRGTSAARDDAAARGRSGIRAGGKDAVLPGPFRPLVGRRAPRRWLGAGASL